MQKQVSHWIVCWQQSCLDGVWTLGITCYTNLADAIREYEMFAAPYAGGPIEYRNVTLAKVIK